MCNKGPLLAFDTSFTSGTVSVEDCIDKQRNLQLQGWLDVPDPQKRGPEAWLQHRNDSAIGCGSSCLAAPSEDYFVCEVRATRQGTVSSKQFGPSLAVSAWEGPGDAGGYAGPYSPGLPPVKTAGRRSEDFRETPRLVVDSLQGNVFVNQYLIIKELGRGAHGSVKLVFDTEEQLVHAMKVIHRKAAPGFARRRNSYSLDSLAACRTPGTPGASTGLPAAAAAAAALGAGSITRGHSLSAGTALLLQLQACGGEDAGVGGGVGHLRGLSCSISISACQGGSPTKSSPSFTQAYAAAMAGSQQAAAAAAAAATAVETGVASSADGTGQQPTQQLLCFGSLTPSGSLPMQLLPPPQQQQQARTQAEVDTAADKQQQQQPLQDLAAALQAAAAAAKDEALSKQLSAPRDADSISVSVSRVPSCTTTFALQATPPSPGLRTASSITSTPAAAAAGVSASAGTCIAAAAAAAASSAFAQASAGRPPIPPPALAPRASLVPSGGRASPAPLPIAAAVEGTTGELVREIAVMKRLAHPHVVKLFEVIHDPDQKLLIMVMEYMPGGPILSSSRVPGLATEPLPEPAARTFFRELVSAVDYLHANLILHGDLKPDNLLLSADGRLKISDFGSATVLPHESALMSTTLGTPAFMAPEMCGLGSSPYAPFPAEVWAVGACLFMFIFSRVPYVANSTGTLYELICSAEPVTLPKQPVLSPALSDLLARLLDKDPARRMKLDEVLGHEWVTDSGRLPAVHRYRESGTQSGGGGAAAKEQGQVLTALKKQVKTAVPNVEKRTYKKGALLVQQGHVPEGLFLILSGTCELVLLSQLPEQHQQQQGGAGAGAVGGSTTPTHSSKLSFSSKIASKAAAAGASAGGRDSPKVVMRTQSSSPMFAAPPRRDADIDFIAQLSDSDDSSDDSEADSEREGPAGCCDAQDYNCGATSSLLDPEGGQAGFPFFRLTASADGARRLQPGGLLGGSGAGIGRPWSPGLGGRGASPSPPPIIEGVPSVSSPTASGFDNSFFMAMRGEGLSPTAAAAAEGGEGDERQQLPSLSAGGGRIPGSIPSSCGAAMLPTKSASAKAAAGAYELSADGAPSSGVGTPQAMSLDGAGAGCSASGAGVAKVKRAGHVKSCSVDFGFLESPTSKAVVQPQHSANSMRQLRSVAAAAGAAGNSAGSFFPAGLQRLQGFPGGFKGAFAGSPDRPSSPAGPLSYATLSQASAPNLGPPGGQGQWLAAEGLQQQQQQQQQYGAGSTGAGGGGGGQGSSSSPLPGGLVQRSANSVIVGASGKVYHRAMRRSESMHKRMVDLVAAAKMRTQTNTKRHELVGIRGAGQIVGDSSLGRPAPAAATVRARSRMRVLLVRPADAAALVSQPSVKAALARTQTESSVLDALETFAVYDGEVAAIDELRRSRAASFAAMAAAGGRCGVGGLASAGSAGRQWLATASSAGSSAAALESYGSVASSLASFTSGAGLGVGGGGAQAAAGGGSRSSPLPTLGLMLGAGGGGSGPLAGLLSPTHGASARTAGGFGFGLPPASPSAAAAAAADFGVAGSLMVVGSGGGSGSPLRPGSRGNSFTTAPSSTTPRGQAGGLRGTSSRLGLKVQTAGVLGQQPLAGLAQSQVLAAAAGGGGGSGSPLPSPRI